MRKQTVTLLAFVLFVLVSVEVCARETTLVLGAEDGWTSALRMDGLLRVTGRHGYEDLSLMPFAYEADLDTEILLHFDELPLVDAAGRNVAIAPSAELSTMTKRAGAAALVVDSPDDCVTLTGAASELFVPGVEWGSFTLEFWLYPATLAQGQRVVEWEGREDSRYDFRIQELTVDVRDRRLVFSFVNFFVPPDGSPFTVSLQGDAGLIPRRWSHHQVRFSEETALLEYLVDGRTAAVTHVTASGRENGNVYFPRIAAIPAAGMRLVPRFSGAIDEFRLLTRVETDPPLHHFHPRGGAVETRVIDLGSPGARVTNVAAVASTPGMTDVFVYLRMSDVRSGADALPGEWVPVDPDAPFEPVMGRYLQVRAELLPDPGTPESPILSELRISYIPDPPPPPPVGLVAIPRDGAVELSWAAGLQEDIRGYLVYYGVQPGRYFGTGAQNGASPLDVGKVTATTLTGLENGTLYYFAVSAYDAAGFHSATELSAEVAARPARVHR